MLFRSRQRQERHKHTDDHLQRSRRAGKGGQGARMGSPGHPLQQQKAAPSAWTSPCSMPRVNKGTATSASDASCRRSCLLSEAGSRDLSKGFPAWTGPVPGERGLERGEQGHQSGPVVITQCGDQGRPLCSLEIPSSHDPQLDDTTRTHFCL